VREAHALGGEAIEVGGFDDRVAGDAERVEAPVVGVEDEDVEGLGGSAA
jgi:hypothetical protein